LRFNFALQHKTRKVQENKEGLELNGEHKFLAYADDVNLINENVSTMKENTNSTIDATKEECLHVNAQKKADVHFSPPG
jgi:hypothetical protein